jgi:hypothetical protein
MLRAVAGERRAASMHISEKARAVLLDLLKENPGTRVRVRLGRG